MASAGGLSSGTSAGDKKLERWELEEQQLSQIPGFWGPLLLLRLEVFDAGSTEGTLTGSWFGSLKVLVALMDGLGLLLVDLLLHWNQ